MVIDNETDYEHALRRLEVISDAPLGTEEGCEHEILTALINAYEKENYSID